ncbi:MAG: hypothetical protein HC902_14865, partial [Calothrix sp. SM1_5_4]|nr:hypothetical protein [Calothrix sp. SM1_5_4]
MRILCCLGFLLLGACSIYQSEGRKFLEKQAYEFAGKTAQANLLGCQSHTVVGSDWAHMSDSPLAQVYVSESESFELRVFPVEAEDGFACDYRFSSAQEMFEKNF